MNENDKADYGHMVLDNLRLGDTITHQTCMGCIEEHICTGGDGLWIKGTPTTDTQRIEGIDLTESKVEISISPSNVLYINRVPVQNIKFMDRAEVKI